MEKKRRSVVKMITWRVIASLDTFIIAYLITGSWKMGTSIASIEIVTKMGLYYIHERYWNKSSYGRRKK